MFGPVSPSPTRLWSWEGRSSRARSPSATAKIDSSSPSRQSSITTSRPASPKARSPIIEAIASSASSTVAHTTAPLPAASPDAFTTTGAPCSRTHASAPAWSRKVRYSAVGTPAPRMRSFAYTLLDSMRAASRVGPKTGRPLATNRSTIPDGEGGLGADDRQVDPLRGRPPGESLDVGGRDGERLAERGHPAVRSRREELGSGGVAPELPEKGVLPPAVAYDEDAHPLKIRKRGARATRPDAPR